MRAYHKELMCHNQHNNCGISYRCAFNLGNSVTVKVSDELEKGLTSLAGVENI